MERFTVFGHEACGFCKQAKKVLGDKELAFRYVDIHKEDISSADLSKTVGQPVRTVPQVFHGEKYIGGYQELAHYLTQLEAA